MNVALSYLLMFVDTHRARQNSGESGFYSFNTLSAPPKTEGFLLIFSLHSELGSLVVANEPLF